MTSACSRWSGKEKDDPVEHVAPADLLRRLGRSEEAREAYDAGIGATANEAERAFLARRRGTLSV